MYAERVSRVVVIVVAALILAAGVAGLLAGAGVFGADNAAHDLLANPVTRYIGQHSGWVWLAAAGLAFLVLCALVWWLLAMLFATGRLDQVRIKAPGDFGGTRLSAEALTEAVEDEIDGYSGVRGSRARLFGDEHRPRLTIQVLAEQDANLGVLCRRLEAGALTHARSALNSPDLPIRIDIDISRRTPARVG